MVVSALFMLVALPRKVLCADPYSSQPQRGRAHRADPGHVFGARRESLAKMRIVRPMPFRHSALRLPARVPSRLHLRAGVNGVKCRCANPCRRNAGFFAGAGPRRAELLHAPCKSRMQMTQEKAGDGWKDRTRLVMRAATRNNNTVSSTRFADLPRIDRALPHVRRHPLPTVGAATATGRRGRPRRTRWERPRVDRARRRRPGRCSAPSGLSAVALALMSVVKAGTTCFVTESVLSYHARSLRQDARAMGVETTYSTRSSARASAT